MLCTPVYNWIIGLGWRERISNALAPALRWLAGHDEEPNVPSGLPEPDKISPCSGHLAIIRLAIFEPRKHWLDGLL